MVTIKQVAESARVSEATVSRVLNGHPKVNPALRQRVLETIDALNYQPSGVARSLRRQQTYTIGLIVPDSRNPFFAELARGIEEFFDDAGYRVYLCNSDDKDDKEIEYCDKLHHQRVAGVIMSITGTTVKGVHYLQGHGMPVVLLDRGHPEAQADTVQSDHYLGACQAVEYLLQLGHRRFGLITGSMHRPPVQDRLRACQDVLRKHGLDPSNVMCYEISSGDRSEYEIGYEGAKHLLGLCERPTAIFAFNDMMAVGALRYTLEHGIRVPDDLSIMGVDNIRLSSFVMPSLTTIAQPIPELGRTAAQLLLDRIQGKSGEFVRKWLPPTLIVRESTGPLAP